MISSNKVYRALSAKTTSCSDEPLAFLDSCHRNKHLPANRKASTSSGKALYIFGCPPSQEVEATESEGTDDYDDDYHGQLVNVYQMWNDFYDNVALYGLLGTIICAVNGDPVEPAGTSGSADNVDESVVELIAESPVAAWFGTCILLLIALALISKLLQLTGIAKRIHVVTTHGSRYRIWRGMLDTWWHWHDAFNFYAFAFWMFKRWYEGRIDVGLLNAILFFFLTYAFPTAVSFTIGVYKLLKGMAPGQDSGPPTTSPTDKSGRRNLLTETAHAYQETPIQPKLQPKDSRFSAVDEFLNSPKNSIESAPKSKAPNRVGEKRATKSQARDTYYVDEEDYEPNEDPVVSDYNLRTRKLVGRYSLRTRRVSDVSLADSEEEDYALERRPSIFGTDLHSSDPQHFLRFTRADIHRSFRSSASQIILYYITNVPTFLKSTTLNLLHLHLNLLIIYLVVSAIRTFFAATTYYVSTFGPVLGLWRWMNDVWPWFGITEGSAAIAERKWTQTQAVPN